MNSKDQGKIRNFIRGIEILIIMIGGAIVKDFVPPRWDYVIGMAVGGLIVQITWNLIRTIEDRREIPK